MYLKLIKTPSINIEKTKKYFDSNYILSLKSKPNFKESLLARFLISKEINKKYGIKNYLLEVNYYGVPIFNNNIYWSISHKKDLIFTGICDSPIGIDVEVYKKRDISLLNKFRYQDYELLSNIDKWDSFYILWTANEAILKKNLSSIDELENIELIGFSNIEKTVNELNFKHELIFNFKGKKHKVLSGKKDNVYFSICI